MSKFLGVEPLGSLNVIKFRHIFTGVNALLLILGQPVDIRQNLKSRLVFLIRNRCNFFIGDALQICKIFRADPTCFYKVSPSLTYIKMACLFQNIGWRMPNHHLIVNELDMYAYA